MFFGYFSKTHRSGKNLSGARSVFKAFGGPKTSKFKYRMYADGSIFDQELQRVVGYVIGESAIDYAWSLHGKGLQTFLRQTLEQ